MYAPPLRLCRSRKETQRLRRLGRLSLIPAFLSVGARLMAGCVGIGGYRAREAHPERCARSTFNLKLKHRVDILDLALRFGVRSLDSRKASHPLQSSVNRVKDIFEDVQGYLAHKKQSLQGPRLSRTSRSQGGAVSYERGTSVSRSAKRGHTDSTGTEGDKGANGT